MPSNRRCPDIGYARFVADHQHVAPGRLELIRAFVNTRHVENGTDAIATPQSLTDWLTAQQLLGPTVAAGQEDVDHALALREALRAALLANHDQLPPPAAAVAELNAAARRASMELVLQPQGTWLAQPTAGGIDAAIGSIVSAVAEAMPGEEWRRLKICANDLCQWAFYDRSRSRARRWCSMDVCGNRVKQQTWRNRHNS
jgi:predicted RNA-binding Zn ribbon-like protein